MHVLAGVADFAITRSRAKVVSFPDTIDLIYHSVFIQNPKPGVHLNAYTDPLHRKTWICIAIFCLVAPTILFFVVMYVHPNCAAYSCLNSCSLGTENATSAIVSSHWLSPTSLRPA